MHNTGIIPKVHGAFKDKLNRHFRRCRVPLLRTHYLIAWLSAGTRNKSSVILR